MIQSGLLGRRREGSAKKTGGGTDGAGVGTEGSVSESGKPRDGDVG